MYEMSNRVIYFKDSLLDKSCYTVNENNIIRKVPRVTHILSSMLHEEYLMQWSNSLGFKRQGYTKTLNIAADIGTQVHELISVYLQTFIMPNLDNIDMSVKNAFMSFEYWWRNVNAKYTTEIIFTEKSIIGRHYAGTLDLLLKVDGKIYLIDFKTSKQVSYKHHLQLAAYIELLQNELNIHVDGCGILLLNKNDVKYTFDILHFHKIEASSYIDSCKYAFISLVNGYYNRCEIEYLYKKII